MELGEPEKNKKLQESKDESWAKLDKRIERARARQVCSPCNRKKLSSWRASKASETLSGLLNRDSRYIYSTYVSLAH